MTKPQPRAPGRPDPDATLDTRGRLSVRLGPFDESDEVNHDPDSWIGEEDDTGFDDMPVECGWEEESDEDDESGDEDDGEDD